MVNIGVFYRYYWRTELRAMHAKLIDNAITVNEADPITCEHTQFVGNFTWVNNTIQGAGDLSDLRRSEIAELLLRAITVPPETM